jgi:hypothetical protein
MQPDLTVVPKHLNEKEKFIAPDALQKGLKAARP